MLTILLPFQQSLAQIVPNPALLTEPPAPSAVENPEERMCLFTDESGCRYRVVYGYDGLNNPVIRIQETKQCPTPINVLGESGPQSVQRCVIRR